MNQDKMEAMEEVLGPEVFRGLQIVGHEDLGLVGYDGECPVMRYCERVLFQDGTDLLIYLDASEAKKSDKSIPECRLENLKKTLKDRYEKSGRRSE